MEEDAVADHLERAGDGVDLAGLGMQLDLVPGAPAESLPTGL